MGETRQFDKTGVTDFEMQKHFDDFFEDVLLNVKTSMAKLKK